MALVFPTGSYQDPKTGLTVISGVTPNVWYQTPRSQANLNKLVNGILTQTPFVYSEIDSVSGRTRVVTSDDGKTIRAELVGSPSVPEVKTTVPPEDPAAGNDPYNENEDLDQDAIDDFKAAEAAEEAAAEAEFDALEAEEAANNAVTQEEADAQNDWRVRLHLGPAADYLYKSTEPGILKPLQATDGIIFPYTPTIAIQHNADYENYDLVHSNYRGYFYRGSQVQNILITATFTANDVEEANYLLASLHFLKSCTKMFYGQDANRGMPPPIVFLTGLGEYQFNNHPCAITMVNENLPNDVDYIPCGKPSGIIATPPPSSAPSTSTARKAGAGLGPDGNPLPTGQNVNASNNTDTTYSKATYVPTKIDVSFTMIPIQTRDQVSKEFSLADYASGKLLKKGFW